jgi:hypothetical protein
LSIIDKEVVAMPKKTHLNDLAIKIFTLFCDWQRKDPKLNIDLCDNIETLIKADQPHELFKLVQNSTQLTAALKLSMQ